MDLGHCQVCGAKLGSHIHSFYSRTQKASVDGDVKTITVLHELQEMAFCGQECWEAMEEQITQGLHPLYQPLNLFGTCSDCRKPVDRAEPHYTLYIGELDDVSQPWLASMRILDEREPSHDGQRLVNARPALPKSGAGESEVPSLASTRGKVATVRRLHPELGSRLAEVLNQAKALDAEGASE